MTPIAIPQLGLQLVSLTPDHAADVAAFVEKNHAAVSQYINSWEDYRNPINVMRDLKSTTPNSMFFGIYGKGSLLGLLRLVPQSWKNWWNLVYAKDPSAPKGLMTEAIAAVIAWLQQQGRKVTLQAQIDLENTRSQKVVERLGFTFRLEHGDFAYYCLRT